MLIAQAKAFAARAIVVIVVDAWVHSLWQILHLYIMGESMEKKSLQKVESQWDQIEYTFKYPRDSQIKFKISPAKFKTRSIFKKTEVNF